MLYMSISPYKDQDLLLWLGQQVTNVLYNGHGPNAD
jgi:hypothetical protein